MSATVLVCGKVFDGASKKLTGPAEILVEGNRIASVARSVDRPHGVRIIDLSDRTVSPGFIDTHVHLTMDAANLARQTLESSASKALKGLSLAREYMNYGFTTLRDLGAADPEWPTVDLRKRHQRRICGRTPARRRSAHLECERRPWRSARLLQPAMDDTSLGHGR
jgi:imidazolonepropionase-like amidohydrolase